VYFHKTRKAFDHHLQEALKVILPGGCFPAPTGQDLQEFLKWDDWRVLGALANGAGGDHGRRLVERDHFREAYHTPEVPGPEDLATLDRVRAELGGIKLAEQKAENSWYKVGIPDIPVRSDNPGRPVRPLSAFSSMLKSLKPSGLVMRYCRTEDQSRARQIVESITGERR
jgi:hypothetical protein